MPIGGASKSTTGFNKDFNQLSTFRPISTQSNPISNYNKYSPTFNVLYPNYNLYDQTFNQFNSGYKKDSKNNNKLYLCLILIIVMFYLFTSQYFSNQKTIADLQLKTQTMEITQKYPIKFNINDFAGIIPPTNTNNINYIISEVKNTTNSDIILVTITSLENYSSDLIINTIKENLGFNSTKKREGLLIFYVADQGKLITTGGYRYNEVFLKKSKTDKVSKQINADFLTSQDYGKGFENLIGELALIITRRNEIQLSQNSLNMFSGKKDIKNNLTAMKFNNLKTNDNIMELVSMGRIYANTDSHSSLTGMDLDNISTSAVNNYTNLILSLQRGESVDLTDLRSNLQNIENIIPFILGIYGVVNTSLANVNAYIESPEYGL